MRQMLESLGLDVERKLWMCFRCSGELGDAHENYKSFLLVHEVSAEVVYPPWIGFRPSPDFTTIREYACPHCGVLMDVEYAPPGYPPLHDFQPDVDAIAASAGDAVETASA